MLSAAAIAMLSKIGAAAAAQNLFSAFSIPPRCVTIAMHKR